MYNISFGAKFSTTGSTSLPYNNENYNKIQERKDNIAQLFEQKTSDDPNSALLLDKCGTLTEDSDLFILAQNMNDDDLDIIKTRFSETIPELKEDKSPRYRFNFTKMLDNLTDEEASNRLVDIYEVLKIKAQQVSIIKGLKLAQQSLKNKYRQYIKEIAQTQRDKQLALKQYTLAHMEMENHIKTTETLSKIEFLNALHNKNLDDYFG